MYLCVFALSLNGVGIGGEQVAGVVDALHEAIAAGYPDGKLVPRLATEVANDFLYLFSDPAMHGLIAGLWSSLSGAGRFVSRVGSGILVDYIGFNATACIVTALQCVLVSRYSIQLIPDSIDICVSFGEYIHLFATT